MRLPPPPGRLIDVGGHRLHFHRAGVGSPVILESALGGSSLTWHHVQPMLSGFAAACTYDRAGFGWSDAGPLPRTAGCIVSELRALLRAADLAPPFVLVGHSFGGLTARLYAQRYASDVRALVLLDPASPEDWRDPTPERRAQIARAIRLCRHGERAARLRLTDVIVTLVLAGALEPARALGRLATRGEFSRLDEGVLVPAGKLPPDVLDLAIRTWTHPRFFQALGSQLACLSASAAELDDDHDFGSLPLLVVSAGTGADERQLGHHARLASCSRHGRHVIAGGSGHWIPLDRPDAVVDAVREVLR
jgi:pimeloyl-ACP methyl ester carboxylesterase